jgi:hypothetical protein
MEASGQYQAPAAPILLPPGGAQPQAPIEVGSWVNPRAVVYNLEKITSCPLACPACTLVTLSEMSWH